MIISVVYMIVTWSVISDSMIMIVYLRHMMMH